MALPLPLPLGLALALGLLCWAWGGGVFFATLEAGFFLGGLVGRLGDLGGEGGGVLPALLVLLPLLLLLVSPARSYNLTQPLRYGSMPPALLPASLLPKTSSTERAKLGHPAQLGDPHEARAASAIGPLRAHPAGVGSTRLQANNLRTET